MLRGSVDPAGGLRRGHLAPPDNIETYPTTVYEGRPVYYYQDRWYYREGPRWNYYRQEPRPLYEHRTRVIVQQAPPARRGPSPEEVRHEREHEDDHRDRR